MKGSPLEIMSCLTALLEEGSQITNPLCEKKVRVLFLEEKKNLPFSNQRKGGRNMNVLKHFD